MAGKNCSKCMNYIYDPKADHLIKFGKNAVEPHYRAIYEEKILWGPFVYRKVRNS